MLVSRVNVVPTIMITPPRIEVGFQNENLVARQVKTKEVLAQVPDLITIVDRNTLETISCVDLSYGQDVIILKLTSPKLMSTEKALKVVGPAAYPMGRIFQLLENKG